ncbi:MAG: hypothetical protein IJ955_09460 [Oscillospiraceae bacterium]|nr:hypothetical protein [Oscillospiraceae bacterium]
MKLLGAVMILFCTFYAYVQYRRRERFLVQLGHALLQDLSLLRFEICVHRRSLPDILVNDLTEGVVSDALWKPLLRLLNERSATMTLSKCWESVLKELPQMLQKHLTPLGSFLSVGGRNLEQVMDEVRLELLEELHREESRQAMNFRIAGAMCFSGACFLILVLI